MLNLRYKITKFKIFFFTFFARVFSTTKQRIRLYKSVIFLRNLKGNFMDLGDILWNFFFFFFSMLPFKLYSCLVPYKKERKLKVFFF
jgi:hypothetical protein